MPALEETLDEIAARRRADPLSIVTVIAPTRLSALQLRRRLAQRGPFAGVRFEVPARLGELIAGSRLAERHRKPLARPIADYVATRIARQSLAPLDGVNDIPGYAQALRQTFRRLRRGGLHDGEEVLAAVPDADAGLGEIARLYSRFRAETARFYDDEDLLEEAVRVIQASPGTVLPELGDVYVVPPSGTTAASRTFLDAIRSLAPSYTAIDDGFLQSSLEQRFILAPDAASEVRNVVRDVIGALGNGVTLDQIAVFTGSDRSYRGLLTQAFEASGVPAVFMPGTPLIEMPAGRGALALARLAVEDYSRVAVFDFLGLAPLPAEIPLKGQKVALAVTNWQRIAIEAGVTRGKGQWAERLKTLILDREATLTAEPEMSAGRRAALEADMAAAEQLRDVFKALSDSLEPLRQKQPASTFVPAFKKVIESWFIHDAGGYAEVIGEVEQLGTIDDVEGAFDLPSFVEAFEANLTLKAVRDRERPLGRGVLVADHRQAAGLRFDRVYLCGAYEGSLPAMTTSEPLIQDEVWRRLRESYPCVDDRELRTQRSVDAVRWVGVAAASRLTWSSPTAAATAARDYYPSSLMTAAAHAIDATIASASDLRTASDGERLWLTRTSSPLSSLLVAGAVDAWEVRLREAVQLRNQGMDSLHRTHELWPGVSMIRGRRSSRFTEYDGNLATLNGLAAPAGGSNLYPSSLEDFATCGMRYFLGNVLRLRPVETPEENQTMGAAERGILVHNVLETFFIEQKANGRPALNERWTLDDQARVLELFEDAYARMREQGKAGLDIYMEQDRRVMKADLVTFLDRDSDYRIEEGMVPHSFEQRLTPTAVGDVMLSGRIDRIDRSPDGKRAMVFDYKTGRNRVKADPEDPFKEGTRLQLPIYVLAADDAEDVKAAYWYISSAGSFERVTYANTAANRERFEEVLYAIVQALHKGAFPAVSGDEDDFRNSWANCTYCDFTRICSARRTYEQQQKSSDSDVLAWLNVAAAARGEERP